jgi:hypothetical protein
MSFWFARSELAFGRLRGKARRVHSCPSSLQSTHEYKHERQWKQKNKDAGAKRGAAQQRGGAAWSRRVTVLGLTVPVSLFACWIALSLPSLWMHRTVNPIAATVRLSAVLCASSLLPPLSM